MTDWPRPLVIPGPAVSSPATSSSSSRGGSSSSSSNHGSSSVSLPPSLLVPLPVPPGSVMSLASVSPPLPVDAPPTGVFTDYPTPAMYDEEQAKLWVTVSVPPKYPDPPSGTAAAAQATDGKLQPLPLRLSHEDLRYHLRAKYIPVQPGSDPIVYLNARDPVFYVRVLPKPRAVIWLLSNNTRWHNAGYCRKRWIEEGYRYQVQMVCINPRRCDLQLSTLKASKSNPSTSSNSSSSDDATLPSVPGATAALGSTETKSSSSSARLVRGDQGRYEGFHIMYEGERVRMPDACVPLIGAVIDYAGLACMRQLEAAGVRMINSPAGIDISRDKFVCHQTLAMAGLPTPRSMMLRRPPDVHLVKRQLGFPCIVKLPSGSKGDAVWKADTPDDLQVLCEKLKNKPLFVQEFIASTKGRDLRLFTAGDRVVAAMMRVARKGFKANVHQGSAVYSVVIDRELEQLALRTAQLSQLDIAGVDLLMDDDGYKVCEVNSAPGFEGLERASAVNVAAECVRFVVAAIETHRAAKAAAPAIPLLRVALQADHMAVASLIAERPSSAAASPATAATPASPLSSSSSSTSNGSTASMIAAALGASNISRIASPVAATSQNGSRR